MAHDPSDDRPRGDERDATRVVRFELAGRTLVVRLAEVAGLAEPGRVHRVPGAAAEIDGIAEWRGRVVTIVDLRSLLDVPTRTRPGPSSWLRLAAPRDHLVLHIDGPVTLSQPARVVETGRPAGPAGFVRPCVRDGEPVELLDPHGLVRALESAQRREGR